MSRLLIYTDNGDFEVMLSTNKALPAGTVVHMGGGIVFNIQRVNYDAETCECWYEACSDMDREFFISNGYKEVTPCSTNSSESSTTPQPS